MQVSAHNERMQPKIIYEDTDILVINKPAGLMVHGDGKSEEKTLADWIVEKYPALLGVGEPQLDQKGQEILRPGIVHRLDRETSGVMVVAKKQDSFLFLKQAFQNHEVKKEYRALVYGVVAKESGTIDAPIGRSRVSGAFTAVRPGPKTREALTEYSVLERFAQYTLLAARPKTGRTHQIRVHLKSIGHAVVCDKLYATKRECPVLGLGRLALHAQALTLPLPNGTQTFEAPLPADMQEALDALRKL